jgi:oxygen-dependent protoporphyrinogen oxidase
VSPPESPPVPTIAVVGGGLAGLTVVHRLLHSGARLEGDTDEGPRWRARIVLLEREKRLGGKILTESFDGFVVEAAADSFLARKPWARALVRELGIAQELVGSQPGWPRAFVRRSGALVPFPDGLTGLVPTRLAPLWTSGILSPRGCARVAMERWIPRRASGTDETVAAFVRRRFGAELYERLMQPLLGGLYGSSPEELSVQATFPVLTDAERKSGSVTRGLKAQARERAQASGGEPEGAPFLSLRGGMGGLIHALEASTGRAEVWLGVGVNAVGRSGDGWSLDVRGRPPLVVDAVVITTPAPVTAGLLKDEDPVLAAAFTQIPFTSTSVVTAAYHLTDFPRALTGHGYLNPLSEGRKVAGVTWSSRKFAGRAPDDRVLLRGFIRDPHLPAPGSAGDERLFAILADELRDAVGLEAEPSWWRVFRWENSMPAYTVGHLERVRTIERRVAELPGLFIAGCSYGGVGIPDTIRSGEDAALGLMNYVH